MITVRKALALLLCLVMCLGLVPAVYAEGGLEAEAVFNSAEAYIATVNGVGCRTLKEINEAISGGGTLILVDDVGGGGTISCPSHAPQSLTSTAKPSTLP